MGFLQRSVQFGPDVMAFLEPIDFLLVKLARTFGNNFYRHFGGTASKRHFDFQVGHHYLFRLFGIFVVPQLIISLAARSDLVLVQMVRIAIGR
jgi:hypothetical protein